MFGVLCSWCLVGCLRYLLTLCITDCLDLVFSDWCYNCWFAGHILFYSVMLLELPFWNVCWWVFFFCSGWIVIRLVASFVFYCNSLFWVFCVLLLFGLVYWLIFHCLGCLDFVFVVVCFVVLCGHICWLCGLLE